VDTQCRREEDCVFGYCVPSTFTWGVLPPPAHRTEIAERWVFFGSRVMGDRNAASRAVTLAPQARATASADTSRKFFGGLNHYVNQLRDGHTSLGSPP